jgi:hypothetical protein
MAVATRQKSTARRLVSAMRGRRAPVALSKVALSISAGTLPMLCGTAADVTIYIPISLIGITASEGIAVNWLTG